MLKNKIHNIKLFGLHGVYKDEIENGQDFIINIEYIPDYKIIDEFSYWLKDTGKIDNAEKGGDKIEDVIDYVDVIEELQRCFNHYRFNLLESLASYLLYCITESFDFKYIKISIKKDFSKSKNKINADSVEVDWEFKFE